MPLAHETRSSWPFRAGAGIYVDKGNRLDVADQYNTRIQMFPYLDLNEAEGTQSPSAPAPAEPPNKKMV